MLRRRWIRVLCAKTVLRRGGAIKLSDQGKLQAQKFLPTVARVVATRQEHAASNSQGAIPGARILGSPYAAVRGASDGCSIRGRPGVTTSEAKPTSANARIVR